ncbi:MAG: ABC-F family ATP-binding cassette domain-containing protein [Lachnospiraceae bacterium]|nr:ABC-F family ATP-binding cassette domain-containing protein [Lachnospiraceae bacterium]
MIFSCNNISKSYVTGTVLDNVSFHVNEHDKVAIVGINGAGKSTLLRIIFGEEAADSGEFFFSKGATQGYLAQHQDIKSEDTIYNVLLSVKEDVLNLENRMRSLEEEMKHAEGEKLSSIMKAYTNATHEFEAGNGYAVKSEVTGVLKGLGFSEDEFEKKVNTLSGGQKTRVFLGRLLLSSPDIIFLDEPTNHLDMSSIMWLENYLLNYKGAVVIVAHDRYFLDKVVNKVVELENTHAESYIGNYSDYAVKKKAKREAMMKAYLNQQREIKHQEAVIEKLKSFNREKSIKRAESREKMLDKIERLEKPAEINDSMRISLEPYTVSGNDVLTVKDLAKSFGDNHLFSGISFDLKRGDHVAIIGDNGTGKTTILKIITGSLEADAGEITLGSKVEIGYYDQEHQVLSPEKTIFEEMADAYPYLDNTQIRNILAAFLFTGDDVYKQIKSLSGGERGRVSLAKLMLSESNLLILDEPTNHLDITSKEILEDAINNYTGTVLYVSHDRYFINKTASTILDLTAGSMIKYIGNYDYYLEKKDTLENVYIQKESAALSSSSDSGKDDWKSQKEEQARLRKNANDLKKVENEIDLLEKRQAEIDELLTKEDIYTDVGELVKLNKEKEEIDEKLIVLMEKWEALS